MPLVGSPFSIICPMATALALFFASNAKLSAAEPRVSTPVVPSLMRVVVLPFQNETGDAAWDDWKQGFAAQIRSCLNEVQSIEAVRGQKMRTVLERAAWKVETADLTQTRQVMRELDADVAVSGKFLRRTNTWVVNVMIVRTNSSAPPVEFQVSSPGWVDLAESVAVRVAEHLGQSITEKNRQRWRAHRTDSEDAIPYLAKAIVLNIQEASGDEREKVLRQLLLADKRCAFAYNDLITILGVEKRTNELEKLTREYLEHRPEVCDAHLGVTGLLWSKNDKQGVERELREALRLHPGCPGAVRGLFALLSNDEKPEEARKLLEKAFTDLPRVLETKILLAYARAEDGDIEGARDLLRTVDELPPEDENIDFALFMAATRTTSLELAGLELLRLGPKATTNESIRETLDSMALHPRGTNGISDSRIVRPRVFTTAEWKAELDRRLSTEERVLVVDPVEVTPEIAAEARRLTAGLPNESTRILALFSEVARRGRGRSDAGRGTANEVLKASRDPKSKLICQEYAKLFVALARAVGIEAWMVHIDRDAFGYPGYHDCAVVFIEGEGLIIDPTWRMVGVPHQEFLILDDLQAISHHAMQPAESGVPDPRRLRMGLKLNPENLWTRLQYVRGMAAAGEYTAAAAELQKAQQGAERWDVYEAAAKLAAAQQEWKPALASLQRALALSPSNAVVHTALSDVYGNLEDPVKAREHLEAALQLNRGEISEDGRERAAFQMALLHAFTQGKSKEKSTQIELQRKAEAGDFAAQMALAKVCFEDKPPRVQEGMRWLRKAAEQGDEQAQFNYAWNLLLMRDPETDAGIKAGQEAIEWFTRSAEQGYDESQYRLGLILYENLLVARDKIAAYQWVLLAAGQGNKEAKSLLKEMEIFLGADEIVAARKRTEAFKPVKKKVNATQRK